MKKIELLKLIETLNGSHEELKLKVEKLNERVGVFEKQVQQGIQNSPNFNGSIGNLD